MRPRLAIDWPTPSTVPWADCAAVREIKAVSEGLVRPLPAARKASTNSKSPMVGAKGKKPNPMAKQTVPTFTSPFSPKRLTRRPTRPPCRITTSTPR
ncbi:hypothetical protein D3C72_1552060 [compost metagenome]